MKNSGQSLIGDVGRYILPREVELPSGHTQLIPHNAEKSTRLPRVLRICRSPQQTLHLRLEHLQLALQVGHLPLKAALPATDSKPIVQ